MNMPQKATLPGPFSEDGREGQAFLAESIEGKSIDY